MRLFIAINFPENIKDSIFDTINELRNQSVSGNFTKYDNLHLTLAFLGEISPSKLNAVKACMDSISFCPFNLELSGAGRFKQRAAGDIYWYGVIPSSSLIHTHDSLCRSLKQAGFDVDDRKYSPHLTLGRQVVPASSFDLRRFSGSVPKLCTRVDCISLMKSERINGRLTYTEIYRKDEDA